MFPATFSCLNVLIHTMGICVRRRVLGRVTVATYVAVDFVIRAVLTLIKGPARGRCSDGNDGHSSQRAEDDNGDEENGESGLSLLGPCLLLVRARRIAGQDGQPPAGAPGMPHRQQPGQLPPNSLHPHSSEEAWEGQGWPCAPPGP